MSWKEVKFLSRLTITISLHGHDYDLKKKVHSSLFKLELGEAIQDILWDEGLHPVGGATVEVL